MNLQKFDEGLKELQEISKKLIDFKKEKIDELSVIDSEISDIYHYIENCNYNAVQGARVLKLLKQTLKKRRVVKDELASIEFVVSSLSDNTRNYIKNSQKTREKIEGKRSYSCKTKILQENIGITQSKFTNK